MGYNYVADSMGLSSSFSRCWLPNLRNPEKIRPCNSSRSSILVSIESTYFLLVTH